MKLPSLASQEVGALLPRLLCIPNDEGKAHEPQPQRVQTYLGIFYEIFYEASSRSIRKGIVDLFSQYARGFEHNNPSGP